MRDIGQPSTTIQQREAANNMDTQLHDYDFSKGSVEEMKDSRNEGNSSLNVTGSQIFNGDNTIASNAFFRTSEREAVPKELEVSLESNEASIG
jgi:hypothetical protein